MILGFSSGHPAPEDPFPMKRPRSLRALLAVSLLFVLAAGCGRSLEDRWIAVCTGLALHPDFLTY